MSVGKTPLSDEEFDSILEKATRFSDDAKKMILLLRYSGMHISVLCNKEYNLHVKIKDGKKYLVWYRPKKRNKNGKINEKEARVTLKISKRINFDVDKFVKRLYRRRGKNLRQKYAYLIKRIGKRAGINDLSPMNFRHTFGVDLIDRGIPRELVREKLNCSDKVLKTYLKYSTKRGEDFFDKIDW